LVGTVIVDEDGIYDPRHPNNRLLLGMKGTMSELELSLFRQRSQEALKQEARRGALALGVAAGYVKVGRDRIEKTTAAERQLELSLRQARYEVAHARRQYDGVDPANRLVASDPGDPEPGGGDAADRARTLGRSTRPCSLPPTALACAYPRSWR